MLATIIEPDAHTVVNIAVVSSDGVPDDGRRWIVETDWHKSASPAIGDTWNGDNPATFQPAATE